jgi:starch-binding outer membrane protein, SusD/RagB family
MKPKNIILYTILGIVTLLAYGCNDKLVENPYTVFTPEYFKTTSGIKNAVYALYSDMRYQAGTEGAVGTDVCGTDEWTYADQVRSNNQAAWVLSMGNYTIDFANGGIATPWNRIFNDINQANAVIKFAPQVAFSNDVTTDTSSRSELVGETRYLRAQYYLILVRQFGAVPVDLGSGDLQFNQTAFQGFNRLPTADILVKDYQVIIDDLLFATQHLPTQRPAGAFRLSKAAAFHLLAKAYLYRAYSDVKQPSDFQDAYNAATEVINNQTKYGVALQSAYAGVHAQGSDYNAEILYAVERIPGNYNANETPDPTGIGGNKGIDASNDFNPDYTSVKSPLSSSADAPCATRTTLYGRPIRRFCPNPWLFNTAFADKDNDSRFDGSFRTIWLATQAVGSFAVGDTGFVLAKSNQIADSLNGITPAGPRLVKYRVIAPREFYFLNGFSGQNIFPALSKYDDSNKGSANNVGSRPFPVSKLSEMYLTAAEAAMQLGNKVEAAKQINVLKLRAANRINLSPNDIKNIIRKSPLGAAAVTGTNLSSDEVNRRYLIIKTADDGSQITLDYILDERTRELCGESLRWSDLAVRHQLVARVKAYNADGAPKIQPYHELRPIPKSQLDAVSDIDKAKYQNPGY